MLFSVGPRDNLIRHVNERDRDMAERHEHDTPARAEDGAHVGPAQDDTGEIPAVPAQVETEAPAATEAELEDDAASEHAETLAVEDDAASQDDTEDAETDERRPGD